MKLRNPKCMDSAKAVLEHRDRFRNATQAAIDIAVPPRTYREWVTRAEKIISQKGYEIPNGYSVKGYSTLHKHHEDGSRTVAVEWVKVDIDKQRAHEALEAAIQAMNERVEKELPVAKPNSTIEDLASCYVLTDYHLGQLSWAEEAGEDWDSEIAFDLLHRWFASAIQSTPDASVGILAQIGDFLHWDGMDAVTPTSKHVLDADTRFSKLVDLAIRAIRIIIKMMLTKHEHVHVIMAEGNHDTASSVWLRALFATLFEDEPRVTIDNTHIPYYCFEWGATSLFFHHGHKKRLAQISEVFAGMYRDVYGRTKYSYAHMGHLHHVESKENQMMIVEQHPTLSAKDAYSARGGYLSKRAASVITYSKKYGEVSRMTIRPEMVG